MAIDAKQLQASGIYESRGPVATLFQDLDQIEALLRDIAGFKRTLRLIAALSAGIGLVCAIAASKLDISALGFFSLLAFTFFLVLFIYSFFHGGKMRKHQDRVTILRDIAKSVQCDADPREAFSSRLILGNQQALVREEDWPRRKGGKQRFYEEIFLSLECELLDGTALTETVTELTRKRTYKNPRGKIKTKLRSRYLTTIRFAYPNDVYGDAQPASSSLNEQMKVPQSATLRDTRVTEKAIVVKATVNRKEDVAQTCAMMGLGAYRILNLARRTAASGTGGKP